MHIIKQIFRIKILVICCFSCGLLIGQNKEYSEIGLNYFLNVIYPKDFDETKIEFSGFTELELAEFLPSLKEGDSIVKHVYKNPIISESGIEIQPKLSNKKIRFKNKRGRKKIKLKIYPLVSRDEKHFVYIRIYKPYHFVEHYILEIDGDGEVQRYWNTGEII